jgi:hypothetical protein
MIADSSRQPSRPPDDPAPRDDSQENRVSQYPPEQSPSGWGNQGGNGAPAPGYGAGETPTYQVPGLPGGPPYGSGGYGPPPGGYGAPQDPGFGYGQQPMLPQPVQPPFPGGYPPYPGGFGPPVQQIPSYLALNIVLLVVSILMCGLFGLPSGITGVVFSNKVRSRQLTGDIQGALSASKVAMTMAIVTGVVMALGIVLVVALIAANLHGSSGQASGGGTF